MLGIKFYVLLFQQEELVVNLMFLAVAAGVLALIFAFVLTSRINKQDAGTERMKEISGSIAEGARAFLFAEYKILVIFAEILK